MICKFEGCGSALTVASAWVPALAVLTRLEGSVSVAVLVKHAHCGRHAAAGRSAGLRFYRYAGTVLVLEQRRTERLARLRDKFGSYLGRKARGSEAIPGSSSREPSPGREPGNRTRDVRQPRPERVVSDPRRSAQVLSPAVGVSDEAEEVRAPAGAGPAYAGRRQAADLQRPPPA